jgi:hypothetical protein
MSFVIVDTNALMRDYLLIEANMQAFLRGCQRCHIKVCMPEVVLDELCANYEKDIRRLAGEFHSSSRKLMKMGVKAKAKEFDIQEEAKSYRNHVRQMMAHYDATLAPYPDVLPKALVEASYSGKKPFKESGEGFKDFLIFETLKAFAVQQGSKGAFVTANRKDFCGSDGQLHPDLQSALPNLVTVFDAIHDFNSKVLSPELEVLDNLAEGIREGKFIGFDLDDTLTNCFTTELCDKYHSIENTGSLVEDATVFSVGSPRTNDITVSRLDQNQLLLELTGQIDLELSGFVPKTNLYALSDEESDNIHIDDPNWNDWVASVSTANDFDFSMTVIFDEEKKQIESISIELEPSDKS